MKQLFLSLLLALPAQGAVFVTLDRPEVTYTPPLTLGQVASIRATAGEPMDELVNLYLPYQQKGELSRVSVQTVLGGRAKVVGLDRVRVGHCLRGWEQRVAQILDVGLTPRLGPRQRITDIKISGERCLWVEDGKPVSVGLKTERISKRIRLILETGQKRRLPLLAELTLEQHLPVLKQSMEANQPLAKANVEWQWRPVYRTTAEGFSLNGRQTTRPLHRGSVLTNENTEAVPDYRRGDQVLVRYHKGGIRIEAKGHLLNGGMDNERGQARLAKNGAVVNVRLAKGGVVYALD